MKGLNDLISCMGDSGDARGRPPSGLLPDRLTGPALLMNTATDRGARS